MKFLIGVLAILIYYPSYGYMLYHGWQWFLAPIGVPAISAAHAVGFAIFLRGALHYSKEASDSGDDEYYRQVMVHLFQPWIILAVMYIVTLFM